MEAYRGLLSGQLVGVQQEGRWNLRFSVLSIPAVAAGGVSYDLNDVLKMST